MVRNLCVCVLVWASLPLGQVRWQQQTLWLRVVWPHWRPPARRRTALCTQWWDVHPSPPQCICSHGSESRCTHTHTVTQTHIKFIKQNAMFCENQKIHLLLFTQQAAQPGPSWWHSPCMSPCRCIQCRGRQPSVTPAGCSCRPAHAQVSHRHCSAELLSSRSGCGHRVDAWISTGVHKKDSGLMK